VKKRAQEDTGREEVGKNCNGKGRGHKMPYHFSGALATCVR